MKRAAFFSLMLWRAERFWFAAGICASLMTLVAGISLLGLSGWFITASGLAGVAGLGLTFDFFRPSAGIRFFALFRTASRYGERLITHDATLRFLASLRANLFSAIAARRLYARGYRGSELLQRLTTDLEALDSLYVRLLVPFATIVAMALLFLALFFVFSWAITLALVAALCLAVLVLLLGGNVMLRDSRRLVLGSEALRVRTIDLVRAHTDLIFAASLRNQVKTIAAATNYLAAAGLRLAKIDVAISAAITAIGTGLVVGLLLIAGTAYQAGHIDGPLLVMLVIASFAALEVLGPLRRGVVEFGRILFASRRLYPIASSKIPASSAVAMLGKETNTVEIRNLSCHRGADRTPIFQNLSLAIKGGERVALIGPSGCGKSTLLSILAGLVEPTGGDYSVRSADAARPTLGYLTQQTELFQATIADNLRIAAPDASDQVLWAALRVVELAEKVASLSDGLNWKLGEAGSGLSGGEMRRLALARVVLRNPQIWLLDEPTAGLDDEIARRVMHNIMQAASGCTMVIAAHHSREAELADRIVNMVN